ncbi:MAG: acylphosphatase [Bacteroidota bacterium]
MSDLDVVKYAEIHCFGLVQGVFYRASTKEQANRLGLKGWVKNLPDSSVLINVYGKSSAVNDLINWCKKGPFLAKVSKVEVSDLLSNHDIDEYQTFEIHH